MSSLKNIPQSVYFYPSSSLSLIAPIVRTFEWTSFFQDYVPSPLNPLSSWHSDSFLSLFQLKKKKKKTQLKSKNPETKGYKELGGGRHMSYLDYMEPWVFAYV